MRINRRLGLGLLSPLGLVLLLTIVIPAGTFFVYSFFTFELLEPQPGFHLHNYSDALSDPLYRKLASHTLAIAAPTTVVTVVLGYTLSYYLAFRAGRARGLVLALVVVSMMASFLARVYAWRTLLGERGVINTALESLGVIHDPLGFLLFSRVAVVIAQVNLFLPFTALVLYASMTTIPHTLHEGARDLGAAGPEVFRRITLPLTGPALLSATAFTFFLSAGDYITPVFLGGPGGVTFGTAISDQLRIAGNYPLGAALAFVMVLAFALLYLLLRTAFKAMRLLPRTATVGA
jgi:spermidine/putrescine transport system permease protein